MGDVVEWTEISQRAAALDLEDSEAALACELRAMPAADIMAAETALEYRRLVALSLAGLPVPVVTKDSLLDRFRAHVERLAQTAVSFVEGSADAYRTRFAAAPPYPWTSSLGTLLFAGPQPTGPGA